MQDYKKTLSDFNTLDLTEKKEKVVAMLEILREGGNVFQDLWNLLHIEEEPNESVLDMIYQVILKAMYSLKEQEMEDAIGHLEGVKDKMNKLKEKEAAGE